MANRTRRFALLAAAISLILAACVRSEIPVAPTGLTITPAAGKIVLSWQDNSSNETGFAIYRQQVTLGTQQGQGGNGGFEEIDTVPPDTTSYEDTNVDVDGAYLYGVSALGPGGSSPLSTPKNSNPVQPVNLAPDADALAVTVDEDNQVTFTVTGSDPEGKSLTFAVASQPGSGQLTGSAPTLTYTPNPNFNGTDSFDFSVSDGPNTTNGTVTITVTPVNDSPTVADSILATTEDTPLSLTLSADDVDGDSLTFEIVSVPAHGSLSGSGAARTYTPDADFTGSDSFRFRVNDGTVNSSIATVILDVKAAGDPPQANAQAITTNEDTPVSIVLSGNDPDGDALTFTLVGSPSNGTLSGSLPNLLYLPDPDFSGSDSFSFTVSDLTSTSAAATVSVTVNPVADAPMFTSTPVTGASQDALYSYDVTAGDADVGDTLTITGATVPAWLTFTDNGGGSATLTGTPSNADVGDHPVTLVVTDALGASDSQIFTITVSNGNDVPTFTSTPVTGATEDSAYSYDVTASDADVGDTLRFTPAATLPGWLTLTDHGDGTATLAGTPDNDDVGDHAVSLRVTDAMGAAATQTFTITVGNSNDAPTFTSTPVTGASQDTLYSYGVTAGDADVGDTLTIAGTTVPAWLTFTDNGGGSATLSGTPTNADVGDHLVVLTVTDAAGASDTQSFTITVSNSNDAPAFTSTPVTTATEDSAYSYAITSSDPDAGDTLRITPASALPGWLTLTDFGDGTAALSGTPTNAQVGSHSVSLRVTDAMGAAATQSFAIAVSNTNDAPTVTAAILDQNATEDVAFSLDVSGNFSDVDVGDTLAFSASGQPSSLVMSGAGVLSGVPTNADVGSHTVTVTADDGNGGTVTDTFTLTVSNSNDAPTVSTPIPDQNATEDVAFSLDVSSNFGDIDVGDTLTFSASGQPSSLVMSSAGVLSGTPTNADVGGHTVTVTADDGNGGTVSDTITLTVNNTNDAPTFTSTPVTGASQDTLYSYGVTAGDADVGDTLTIAGITVPAWLTFTDNGGGSATLSGTPTNADVGDHPVVLTVTDAAGASDTQSFTITVSNSNDAPAFTSTPVTTATEDSAYSYAVTTSDPDAGDSLTISGDTLPDWLTVTDNGDSTATLAGTPDNDDVGPHAVSLRVTDAAGAVATQSFTVTVANTNDAPTADDVAVSATEDGAAVTAAFAGSDVDAGDTLTYALSGTPAEGSVTNNNDGTFTFDPGADFQDLAQGASRNVSFGYSATDAQAATSNSATVTVTVTGVNDAPIITEGASLALGTGEDQVLSTILHATDVDGDILSWSVSSPASNGTALASGAGTSQTVVYTPDAGFNGSDSFDILVEDGLGGSDTITINVTITASNDAPAWVSTPVSSVDEDTPYSYSLVTSDSDAGDTLELNAIVLPAWLTLTDNGDGTGSLTGAPTNDEVGVHPVSLVVSDAAGAATLQSFNLTVVNTNDSPVITQGDGPLAVTMDEDGNPTPFALSLDATDVDVGDTLSWSISSPAGNGTASVDSNGVVSYTPDADYFGSDSFVVQVSDGYAGPVDGINKAPTDTVTVNVTINPVEDAPIAVDDAFSVDEDGVLSGNVITEVNLAGDSDYDPDGDPVTVVDMNPATAGVIDPISGPSNGSLTLNSDGSFSYTPNADFSGSDSFSYRITDDPADTRTADATVTITVNPINDAPSFELPASPNQTVDEDAPAQTVALFATNFQPGGGADEAGQTILDYIVTNDNNALFSAQPDIANNGTLTYTPAANANGSATVTVQVQDDGGTANAGDVDTSAALTFTITVNAINDAPSFELPASPDQTVDEDAGAQTVPSFATNFQPGGGTDEASQTILDYIVTNDNNALFSSQPDIANDGTLTYTPAANANGSATVTVQVQDDGGTANAGDVDTSAALTFTITVNAINDAPSFELPASPDQTVDEDAGIQTVLTFATNFQPGGGADEAGQTILDYIVTNDNNALFSAQPDIANDGTLTYTPAADANGSATVTVQVQDDGGTANAGDVDTSAALTFTITVNAINDAPSFELPASPDQTVDEDAGAQTVASFATNFQPGGGSDEASQSILDYTVTNDNNALFSTQPDIANDGTLTYTPAANANGSATVTVQVQDDGGTANAGDVDTSAALTFTITVNAVNDAPFAADDTGATDADTILITVDPGATLSLFANDSDVDGDSLTVVSFDGTSTEGATVNVFPDGQFSYDPRFAAPLQALCTTQTLDDTFTYTISDGNGGTDTATVTITVTGTVNCGS